MNKRIFIKGMLAGLLTLSFAACSEPADEIKSNTYSRNFSPVNIEARVVNQTQIRMNWAKVEGATAYNIEVFKGNMQFEGTPIKTVQITNDQLPYLLTGLEGEEWYSIRIQAITAGDDSRASKWSNISVETGREQIFKEVAETDLNYTSVTLRWPAGEEADYITVTPGNIRHDLTASEIADGAVTITGLTNDTEYKAVMTRGTKTRGTITFTTPLDLGGATKVEADQTLADVIAAANDGDVLALMPGTYAIAASEEAAYENGSLKITKSLTIRSAKSKDRATIKGRITIENEASLELNQVIIDCSKTDGGQAINVVGEGEYDHVNIKDCEIFGSVKGLFYLNVAAKISTVSFNNCLIHDIVCTGGDFIDNRLGYIGTFSLTNSTLYNSCADRDVFRFDGAGQSNTFAEKGLTTNIIVDHNTFYNIGNAAANRMIFYIRFVSNTITFTNNLVVGFNNNRGFTNNSATAQAPTLSGNYYWQTENLLSLAAENTQTVKWFDTDGKIADPGFADATNGNFTVTNEDIKYYGAGDPRWNK